MRFPRPAFLTGLLLPACAVALAGAIPATTAHAEVHRCTAPSGESIYTDKSCSAIGAIDRRPQSVAGPAGASRLYRSSCSRTLQDLVYELTSAIDSRDVNRLAGLYDWAGMGTANANRVMNQLQAIARREVVEVRQVHAGERWEAADPWLAPPPSGPPVGLRVEQVQANGHTPARASFGLRQRMGCWWVRM